MEDERCKPWIRSNYYYKYTFFNDVRRLIPRRRLTFDLWYLLPNCNPPLLKTRWLHLTLQSGRRSVGEMCFCIGEALEHESPASITPF